MKITVSVVCLFDSSLPNTWRNLLSFLQVKTFLEHASSRHLQIYQITPFHFHRTVISFNFRTLYSSVKDEAIPVQAYYRV